MKLWIPLILPSDVTMWSSIEINRPTLGTEIGDQKLLLVLLNQHYSIEIFEISSLIRKTAIKIES